MTSPSVPFVPLPTEIYASFCSPIDQSAVQRITASFTNAMSRQAKHIHLFFHSNGGSVSDGIAIYNFFRALPIDLTIYNPGMCFSIAAVAYLGAKERKVSANAIFGFHRSTMTTNQPIGVADSRAAVKGLGMDDARTEAIIREHATLPKDKWRDLDKTNLWLTAEEAVRYGVAHEVADFAAPPGTMIFSI